MTTRIYYVNPADTADITLVGREGNVKVTLPDGRTIERLYHEPAWDVYYAIEDNTAQPDYHLRDPDTLTFVGTVGNDAARVQEARNFSQMPIDDLYEIKKDEIARKDYEATYNTLDTGLSTNWWLVITELARVRLQSIIAALVTGTPWPSNPANHPWLGIYNDAAVRDPLRRYQVNQSQHAQLMQELAIHDDTVGQATEASLSALEATYNDGAGDWQTLADHDPSDPAWGYPPYIVLDPDAAAQAGRLG